MLFRWRRRSIRKNRGMPRMALRTRMSVSSPRWPYSMGVRSLWVPLLAPGSSCLPLVCLKEQVRWTWLCWCGSFPACSPWLALTVTRNWAAWSRRLGRIMHISWSPLVPSWLSSGYGLSVSSYDHARKPSWHWPSRSTPPNPSFRSAIRQTLRFDFWPPCAFVSHSLLHHV